jgi:hypothetical protein
MTVDGPMIQAIAAMVGITLMSAAFWLALRYAE